MFNLFAKDRSDQPPQIRDALFGDMPLDAFLGAKQETHDAEPWASFERVRILIESNDPQGAAQILHAILAMPQFESRCYLQAWHVLRQLGEQPGPDSVKQLLGIVVEVGVPKGLDLVAAYADHHARYYNFSGAGVVREHPNDSLDAAIDNLLKLGASVVRAIGPWKEARPGPPAKDEARLNFLTPSGLHFGQGPMAALSKDRMAGPVLAAAFQLMQQLIAQTKR
ncbi:MAG: hypothetical protein WCC26_16705 [Terracidiphilus sp.]